MMQQAAIRYAPGVVPRDYGLRWYQEEAKAAVEVELGSHRSTLLVLPTGLGKTSVFAAIAGDWEQGDVLVLAHRDELIVQAQRRIELLTGEQVEVEQAQLQSAVNSRIVVGSMQSFNEKRLERLGRGRFGLVVIDEGHHAPATTYRQIMDWFADAKILGATATPDRGDKKALGQCFETVAYSMSAEDGVEQGYLVPVDGRTVRLGTIQLDGVQTRLGDLVAGQLDRAMVAAVEGIVEKTFEFAGERRGPVFMPGTKSAELAAERFNVRRPGCAAFVHAKTDPEERREIIRRCLAGEIQYLVNVGIAAEGFDWPDADVVVSGRPTKNRGLYAQQAGRGLRVLPGVVDHIPGKDGAAARRQAIAESWKPGCLLLDFAGNSDKHSLVGPEDILGGKYSEAEMKLARQKREGGGGNVQSYLESARRELQKLAREMSAKVEAESRTFDPFRSLGVRFAPDQLSLTGQKPASQRMRDYLREKGVEDHHLEGLTHEAAVKLQRHLEMRMKYGMASLKKMRLLIRLGLAPPTNLSRAGADRAINLVKANNWRVPADGSAQKAMERRRDAGDDR